jgi:hypothetical protein
LIYINFIFDFLDLHRNVFFENTSPINELTRLIVFEVLFKTFAARVLSDLKILGFASYIFISYNTLLYSCFK